MSSLIEPMKASFKPTLWSSNFGQSVGLKLAFIGSIKDDIINLDELAAELISFLTSSYPGVLADKYQIDETKDKFSCLAEIAENRHCLSRGSELDISKAAILLLDDFRNGRLGKITLEFTGDDNNEI